VKTTSWETPEEVERKHREAHEMRGLRRAHEHEETAHPGAGDDEDRGSALPEASREVQRKELARFHPAVEEVSRGSRTVPKARSGRSKP